jgi:threonylcarbamoyladenosine tRNA methylthiotransferase CDKAL1
MTKIYFQTHGCSTNLSEAEVMMGLLNRAGFELVEEADEADLLVINICTVKGEETAIRQTRKLHEAYPDKQMIVAGCLTKIVMREIRNIKDDISFINTHNIKSIVDVIEWQHYGCNRDGRIQED